MTAPELELYEQSVPKVVGVRPTQLLVDRVRESQGKAGGTSSRTADVGALEAEVVPFGSDIVTAPAGEANRRVATAAVTALPRTVDNSTSPAFPEIRNQESIGSCVAFAVGYYQYTYSLGKLAGWNNKNTTNTTKVSPKFLYNLANGGEDYGTFAYAVHTLLREHGAATWSEFPYAGNAANPVNYRAWPTSATIWKNALRYKSLGFASVGTPADDASFTQAKNLLANGQVLTFSTYIYSWAFDDVGNDPSTSVDDAFAGQRIATWQDGWEGPHEATIVGYNDDIWVDINANGVVESSEKGAFKIANSWGIDWMNAGYAWVAYDALYSTSRVPNGPSSESRGNIIGEVTALAGARTNYQPQLLAEFTVSTASRAQLALSIQQTELDRTDVVDEFRPMPFYWHGGNFAYDGTVTTQAKTASLAIDLSEVALSYGDLRYRIVGENLHPTASRISGFSVTDRLRNNLKTTTTDAAVTIGRNEIKAQSIRYKFQDPARVPRLTVTPSGSSIAFGTLPLGQSARRQLTLQNTGTGDLAVSSLRFDNPLFLTDGPPAFRIPAGTSWVVDLEFAPAATQSETGTLSLRNTSSNQPSPTFTLSGAATSTNDSAPYQVFITQQNSPTDNSVTLRAELKSRVTTSTALSNYQVVYYLNDPGVDPTSLLWETAYSNIGTVSASTKRVFLTRTLGPRNADLALTFRFAPGATLAAGGSVIFQGTLRKADYTWYPNENDDWSRFLRRNGMAEGTIVQQISNGNVLFGLPAEGTPGAYQLKVTPNPTTSLATVSFTVTNPSEVNIGIGMYIFNELGDIQDFRPLWVSELGTQSVEIDTGWYPPGRYTAVIQRTTNRLDAFTFTRQ